MPASEVSIDKSSGKIKVHKTWVAVDGGLVVQPEMARANVESAIIYGLLSAPVPAATSNQENHAGTAPYDIASESDPTAHYPAADLAQCFLRLVNLPTFPLDRLSRYEAILWRQAGQIVFALEALRRRTLHDEASQFGRRL